MKDTNPKKDATLDLPIDAKVTTEPTPPNWKPPKPGDQQPGEPPPAKLQLVPAEPNQNALATRDPESILRFAIEKGADVGVIERIMAVRRELRGEQAEAEYNSAMAKLQSEMPMIVKEKVVTTGAEKLYAYAPFEAIVAQAKPFLQKYGFSYTLDTDVDSKDGWVIAKCEVIHEAGHKKTSTAKFPLGAGTRAMSTTQVFAAALTFASRRVFCNAFGIVTAGDDIDGQTGRIKPAGPSKLKGDKAVDPLVSELWKVLEPVRGTEKNWNAANQWLWREEILDGGAQEAAPLLPPARLKEVIAKVKEKLKLLK